MLSAHTKEPLRVGDWSETEKVFDDQQVEQFAALSEDNNPIHLDAGFSPYAYRLECKASELTSVP